MLLKHSVKIQNKDGFDRFLMKDVSSTTFQKNISHMTLYLSIASIRILSLNPSRNTNDPSKTSKIYLAENRLLLSLNKYCSHKIEIEIDIIFPLNLKQALLSRLSLLCIIIFNVELLCRRSDNSHLCLYEILFLCV